eukprot:CAMPEP_0173287468 /NCGR_PEP_ID=MMETSP1143-20121109/9812_1 /TAXON_ID=483371 /ORGANISM="non described non described, Strain CCMP2298" /LENGTH=145 /DNA_ID=CAMNT_0014225993 /DNA_START=250 /DNA_END=688 /DNA_ORIENTATION=-
MARGVDATSIHLDALLEPGDIIPWDSFLHTSHSSSSSSPLSLSLFLANFSNSVRIISSTASCREGSFASCASCASCPASFSGCMVTISDSFCRVWKEDSPVGLHSMTLHWPLFLLFGRLPIQKFESVRLFIALLIALLLVLLCSA